MVGDGNYHLRAGSPMLDAGIDLTRWGWSVGSTDFSGVRLPQRSAVDIGASGPVKP